MFSDSLKYIIIGKLGNISVNICNKFSVLYIMFPKNLQIL